MNFNRVLIITLWMNIAAKINYFFQVRKKKSHPRVEPRRDPPPARRTLLIPPPVTPPPRPRRALQRPARPLLHAVAGRRPHHGVHPDRGHARGAAARAVRG